MKLLFKQALVLAALGLSMAACAPSGGPWLRNITASDANNQIMLVRESPPSYGYQRLAIQAGAYPDLGVFVGQQGLPDFLAETRSRDRNYLILYYLKKRQAFACRTRGARSRDVEFAGPYPITPREYQLLDRFRRVASERRAAQAQ